MAEDKPVNFDDAPESEFEDTSVPIVNDDVDAHADDFYDATQTASLSKKVNTLEWENGELERENREAKTKIDKLSEEVEVLKSVEKEMKQKLREMEVEVEKNDEGKNVFESVANRAMDLETEVARLQQDLVTAEVDTQEANTELAEVKRALAEKVEVIDGLEKEVEEMKKVKSENEKKVRELERNIGVLEVKESEEKSKRIRVEEETREKMEAKEGEVVLFQKKIELVEEEKRKLELASRESEDKLKAMEVKMVQLQKEVMESRRLIGEVKDKTVGAINGTVNEMKEILEGESETGSKGLSMPVIAGSAGAVLAVAGVVCLFYVRKR